MRTFKIFYSNIDPSKTNTLKQDKRHIVSEIVPTVSRVTIVFEDTSSAIAFIDVKLGFWKFIKTQIFGLGVSRLFPVSVYDMQAGQFLAANEFVIVYNI